MPNWCGCILTVSGDKDEIDRFLQAAHEVPELTSDDDITISSDLSVLSFERLLPTPDALKGKNAHHPLALLSREPATPEEEKADDWYSWRVRNWGTKWDVSAQIAPGDTDDRIEITFDTAWSPPIPAIEKISQMFPTLEFELEYDEPGMDFWGIVTIVNGVTLSEESGNSQIAAEWAEDEEEEDEGETVTFTLSQATFPQTPEEAIVCPHGNRVWFGHECGECD